MAVSSSPQCRITWTDVVNESQHYSFALDSPLELRFGLEVSAHFWDLFDDDAAFIWFSVYRFGEQRTRLQFTRTTNALPGTGERELWLGVALGKASQATDNGIGIFQFRPQIWFQRNGPAGGPGKFASAPADHSFLVEMGGESFTGSEERLIGGAGSPPGSPPPD